MTKTVVMKAADLCEGDKVRADGVTYTVRRAKQIKRKIPARYEKQTHLILETKGKVNGRSSKKQETTTLFSDDEVEVMSRPGMRWKMDRFKEANARYINTFACALTGSGITLASGLGGYTPMLASMGMLGLTLIASILVYIYTE
jgi:hypothetical protein